MRPRPGVLPASPQQQEEPRTPRLTLHTPSYPAPTPNTQPPALSLPPDLGGTPWVGGWIDVGKQGWAGVLQPAQSSLGLRLSPESTTSMCILYSMFPVPLFSAAAASPLETYVKLPISGTSEHLQ